MDLLASSSPDIAWSPTDPPGRSLVAVTDEVESPADFLVHYFLSLYLRGGHRVCLLATSASTQHYATSCRKQGIPFDTHVREGRIHVVDIISDHVIHAGDGDGPSLESLRAEAGSEPADGAGSQPAPTRDQTQGPDPGTVLVDRVRALAAEEGHVCFIVDDLTLLTPAVGVGASRRVLAALRHMAGTNPHVCVVVRGQAEAATGYAGSRSPTAAGVQLASLQGAADVTISVVPLATGAAKDISGQVIARRRRTPQRPCPVDVSLQCSTGADGGHVRLVRRGDAELGR